MSTVLIIDDEEPVRKLLKELFESNGYDVLDAKDGHEGLDLCREQRPDLVISDLAMPVKSGVEVIFEIKRDWPSIKVIAISGDGRDPREYLDSINQCVDLDDHFTKPFEMDDILSAVKKLIP